MSRLSPPLVFLAAAVGLWAIGRAAVLAPDWTRSPPAGPLAAAPSPVAPPGADAIPPAVSAPADQVFAPLGGPAWARPLPARLHPGTGRSPFRAPLRVASSVRVGGQPPLTVVPTPIFPQTRLLPPPGGFAPAPARVVQPGDALPLAAAGRTRLAGSAWLLVRDDVAGPSLAPGGTLGGSQAGVRLTYRLNNDAQRPLALSARAYVPLARPQGSEVAVGFDWRPVAAVPIHALVERRERIGREGRSDFSLTLYGGVDRRLARGRLRLEAYGQAGVVGLEERDLFADGQARLTTPVGPVQVGGGVWGGAQPGVERLDVGPHLSAQVPIGPISLRIAAEWRVRVAGAASPASGPALTLATDF